MAKELCGDRGLASLVMMMGVKQFYPLDAQEGKHLGGFAFRYNRRLTSNKSNLVRIYAHEDGTRTMAWFYMHPQTLDIDEVDRAVRILPEKPILFWKLIVRMPSSKRLQKSRITRRLQRLR